jgi:hypothetical protein
VRRRGGIALGLLAALAIAAGPPAGAQGPTAPIAATLILKDPPPNVTYGMTQPIVMVLEVRNPSGAPVVTTEGFTRTEFWRQLFFTDPQGRTIGNTGQAPDEGQRTFFCLSRNGVLLRPTALPVVPLEVLEPTVVAANQSASGFFVSYTIDDARRYYDLVAPGRYTVNARIPLQTFQTDTAALISDCDQLAGETVANVSAVSGRRAFTVVSNSLEFVVGSPLRFGGFGKPLIGDEQCRNAARSPCSIARLNRALPVKFQLFGADSAPITTAHPRIVVTDAAGGTATLKGDTFKYDAAGQQYVYTLHTQSLHAGVWRIDVIIDIDGSVHSAHVGLR